MRKPEEIRDQVGATAYSDVTVRPTPHPVAPSLKLAQELAAERACSPHQWVAHGPHAKLAITHEEREALLQSGANESADHYPDPPDLD